MPKSRPSDAARVADAAERESASPRATIRTFLIADVRGYTVYTEDFGDEAAARLASKFAELAREVVEAHDGSVIELRGDEALAVFESPRQAIRAAIELQLAFVEATVADPTLPLPVGIGLDAGEAVPIEGGYRGGALNLAARLCSLAGPGEVLASREVAHLARKVEGVKYVEHGPVRLKGLADPIDAVRVRPELEDLAQDVAFRRALGPLGAHAAEGLEARNPYKGLRAFEEADAGDFFGREALTARLVDRLAETRFLAVVGPSGSGKSSVVRAGLVPALRRGALPGSETWRIVEMFPGGYPLEELEAALLRVAANPPASLMEQLEDGERGLLRAVKRILPGDGTDLVLVLDQLEEVFTLVEDEGRRAHFLSILERAVTDPHSRLRVVTTLRADFYDRPLLYSGFAELLRDFVEAVVPLAPDEFERAISGPAERVGVRLEPGLLAEMVADVADEPGALPLLQYALTELHERREGSVLTREAYHAIGGVSGALARRAEEIYEALLKPAQDATRQLFLRLVTLGEGTEDTRRRVDRRELGSIEVDQAALTEALDDFGTSRLLSFDRDPRTGVPTIEVAHEALLREWARLRRWIDAGREDVRMHRRLAAAAAEWEQSDRDRSFLLRGGHLAQFESWSEESGIAPTELEREYLATSIRERESEEAAEDARRAHEAALERRSVNRLRALVGVLALAAVVAVGLTIFAFNESRESDRQAQIATGRELTAASAANLDVDPERSILLALEAIETFRSASDTVPREPVETLHRALQASRVQLSLRNPATQSAVFSPRGRLVATAGPDGISGGRVVLWDARTGRRLRVVGRTELPITGLALAFSPDGSRLYAGAGSRDTFGWDVRSGKRLLVLPGGGDTLSDVVVVSPDGTKIATTSLGGTLRIWNARSGEPVLTVSHPSPLCGADFSPDGARIAAAKCFAGDERAEGTAIWDTGTGKRLLDLPPHANPIGVAFSPDGTRLATTSSDGKGRIWDSRSGRLSTTLVGHTGDTFAVAFSADGKRVATGSSDATARVWDAASGRQLLVLAGHTERVSGVEFDASGNRVLTASRDGTARVWDVSPAGERDALTLRADGVSMLAYSPNGRSLVTGGRGRASAVLWDASTGRRQRVLEAPANVREVSFAPDGRRIALAGGGSVTVVDGRTGAVVRKLPPSGFVPSAAWSPDGSTVAVAVGERAVLWDPRTGRQLDDFVHTSRNPNAPAIARVIFAPSPARLLAGGFDGTITIWNVSSRAQLRRLAAYTGIGDVAIRALAVNRDGTRFATAAPEGTAKIWELPSGRLVATLTGHSGGVAGVAFSPDGSQVATAGDDTTARLWDAAAGHELLSLTGAGLGLSSVAFSPDGRRLATASADGNVRVYILPLDELMAVARSRLTRGWTKAECRQFLGTDRCPDVR